MDRQDGNSAPSSRRSFVDRLLGTATAGFLGSVLYPVIRYLIPPDLAEAATSTVALDLAAEELAPNSRRIFKFGNKPGILVRTPSGDLRVFSAICTHLACTVQCHFDLRAINVAGPTPRTLEPYAGTARGGKIVVARRS